VVNGQVLEQVSSKDAVRATVEQCSQVKANGSSLSTLPLPALALSMLALAGALLAAQSARSGCCALFITVLLLVIDMKRPASDPPMSTATVVFEPGLSLETVPAHQARNTEPLWIGRWKLDKSCSDPYEPILAELGITYLLRKAIDAKTSTLQIECKDSAVVLTVTNLVTVVDVLPMDGSHILRPVPPGAKVKGTMKVRLVSHTPTELVLSSELPEGEGELVDVTTIHEGGAWLSRRTKLGQTEVTRVFRRMQ